MLDGVSILEATWLEELIAKVKNWDVFHIMSEDAYFILKVFFGIVAGIFTVLAAVFYFFDESQNNKTEKTQAWFRAKWESINKSRWLKLPENATRWLLNKRVFFSKSILRILNNIWVMRTLGASISILLFVACLTYWGKWIAFLSLIFSFPNLLVISESFLDMLERPSGILKVYSVLSILFSPMITVFLCLQIILEQHLYFAALIMIVFVPFFWITTFIPLVGFNSLTKDKVGARNKVIALFLVGVAGGFTVTLLALSLGHIVEPSAYVPQTLQMLVSNVMFDGLTMAITFAILDKALLKEGMLRLPAAIVLDIVVAGIFAVFSLYFGLVLTDKAISLKDTLHILFARSADNSHFELSPYFWVMHTTFIPTLLYLSMILFCWTGKALLIPVQWFFGKGHEHKNPLKLTATLCGIFIAVFTVLSLAAGSAQERIKDLKSIQNPPVINESR